jgi:hypothetical protein
MLLDALEKYGPAPGAQAMLNGERAAAQNALAVGVYVSWRSRKGQDCTRVGPDSLCFCGHLYSSHGGPSNAGWKRNRMTCDEHSCTCVNFSFIPRRPEECGEWWLVRRKDFDIRSYQAKCKCGHSHSEHDPKGMHSCTARCGCSSWTSAFLCVVCDCHSEEHETVWETEAERISGKRPVGDAYLPFAEAPEIGKLVFDRPKGSVQKRPGEAPSRIGIKAPARSVAPSAAAAAAPNLRISARIPHAGPAATAEHQSLTAEFAQLRPPSSRTSDDSYRIVASRASAAASSIAAAASSRSSSSSSARAQRLTLEAEMVCSKEVRRSHICWCETLLTDLPHSRCRTVMSANLQQALLVQEDYPLDLENALDVFPFTALLEYNHRCIRQLSASRHVFLNDRETLSYSYVPLGCESVTQAQNELYFQKLLKYTTDTGEQQRLIELKANPNITYVYMAVEVHPSSLQVQLVREVQTSTLGSFVADLGQLSSHLRSDGQFGN